MKTLKDLLGNFGVFDQIFIHGNNSTAGVLYAALRESVEFGLRFVAFVGEGGRIGEKVFGQSRVGFSDIDRAADSIIITDRNIDEASCGARFLSLSKTDVSIIRSEYAEYVTDKLRAQKSVMLYGAGEFGKAVLNCLKNLLKVECFIVSNSQGQEAYADGVPLVSIDEIPPDNETAVFISTDERHHLSVVNTLAANDIKEYYPLTSEAVSKIYGRFLAEYFGSSAWVLTQTPRAEFYIHSDAGIARDYRLQPHWRVRSVNLAFWESFREFLNAADLSSYYAEMYGDYICSKNAAPAEASAVHSKCFVYMARSDFDFATGIDELPEWLIPIHVGASLSDNFLARIRDDTGENISRLNRYFSEMTAMYWIWKNAALNAGREDFLGLCHYRRHFDMNQKDINNLLRSEVDIVITCPEINQDGNIEYYLRNGAINPKVLEILRGILRSRFSDYLNFFDSVSRYRMLHPFNMCIMRRNWFIKYCEWVFGICLELHTQCEMLKLTEKRYLGYITELLLSTFCAAHKSEVKIAVTDRVMLY